MGTKKKPIHYVRCKVFDKNYIIIIFFSRISEPVFVKAEMS